MNIHPTAVVDPTARLGEGVSVGPFCVIEPGVRVGRGCRIAARATIKTGVSLGEENFVGEGAVLGGAPQHLAPPGEPGSVIVGHRNVIREHVTVHRAMHREKQTRIGDGCLLMVASHVAHDCQIGDHVVLTNNVMLAGHVTVGPRACLGGGAAVHQHCRIGRLAMVGGMARVVQDIPPFLLIDGKTDHVVGLNRIGLRRAGIDREGVRDLKGAYQIIYRSGRSLDERLEALAAAYPAGPAAEFEGFLRGGTRGFVRERRSPPGGTIRVLRDDADTAPAPPLGAARRAG